MHPTITVQLEQVARLRHQAATEVIAEAVEIGVSKLYQDSVLKQYLNKRICRRKAIQLVGIDIVKLAETQHKITQKDITWGLSNG